jgi:aquaporin Z
MIKEFIAEFLGTFVFFSVILQHGQAIPIAIALATAIYFGGSISGGNFNPAVSLMMLINGTHTFSKFIVYVIAQSIAAGVAVGFYNMVKVVKP